MYKMGPVDVRLFGFMCKLRSQNFTSVFKIVVRRVN